MRILFSHATHLDGRPALEVSGLTVKYDHLVGIENITFQLDEGERVAVVGPNGAGKSTLFKAIAGILQPTAGQVKICGTEPTGHNCIAYLPQSSQVEWEFPLTVQDVVMMGRIGKLGLIRHPKSYDREIVLDSLEVVGMSDLAGRRINELSGGQQQRMFIARALAQETHLMVMDEPLAGLDLPAQEEILHVLEELHRLGVTVLVSTHDLTEATEHFERIMLLNIRILGIGSPREVFTPENLREAYGSHLQMVETENGLIVVSDTCCAKGDMPDG